MLLDKVGYKASTLGRKNPDIIKRRIIIIPKAIEITPNLLSPLTNPITPSIKGIIKV